MQKSNRREVFLINPKFQLQFMLTMTGLAAAIILIYFGSLMYFLSEIKNLGLSIGLIKTHPYFAFISRMENNLIWIFSISTVVVLFFITIFSLVFSHRIAGPIHQLKEHLQSISENKKYRNLSFRKKDFFSEVPEFVNRAIDSLEKADRNSDGAVIEE